MTTQPDDKFDDLRNEGPTKSTRRDSGDLDNVFRDFEVSRVQTLTETIRNRPGFSSLVFLGFLTFWTASLSYGVILFGVNNVAVNLCPHIAAHAVILGFMIYPVRLFWIPITGFILLYLFPYSLPFTGKPQWIFLSEANTATAGFFFVSNFVASGLTGLSTRWLFRQLIARTQPQVADILTVAALFVLSLIFFLPQVFVAEWFAGHFAPEEARGLGFHEHYVFLATERTLRGAVISCAFLIATLQMPTARQMKIAAPAFLLFPLAAVLHNLGHGGFPMLDMGLLAIVLALVLPVSTVPIIVIAGISFYMSLTGEIVNGAISINEESSLLESYSTAVLLLLVIVMALRGRERHEREQHIASIRRLRTVRGFAGVGLFTLNVPRNQIRLDPAGRQLLGLNDEAGLDGLLERFRAEERYLLRHAIQSESHASITLLLRMADTLASGDPRVLRLHLWTEPTPRGEKVVYGLMVEVTEEHLQEQALTDALNELSMRQDRQKQLFSIVSHEIRTPASVLSMLIDDLESGHNSKQLQGQMREAASQLLSVLDDMRQAVNPEKNQPLTITPYIPADIAERVRNTYQILAKGQDIRITLDLGPGASSQLMGDSNRLKQVLGNLVRNAIIHSRGSEIRIAYQPQDLPPMEGGKDCPSSWTVTDNGIGIPLEEVERLFQPFERGSADARNQADGSGLGLYIVKQSVDLLGGNIEYFPAPEGGAGYCLCLPDRPASEAELQAAAPKIPVEQKKLEDLRVLLAEDNALVAQVTSKQLGRVFGEIDLAENGRVALEKIRETPPDVLITDLFMPEMPGDELVAALRAEAIDIPMIGLTAAVVGDDIHRFEEAGTNAVLPKPLDVARLCALLKDRVEGERCEGGAK